MGIRKIIFLCKYNAFRSKVAERYFNKINKNKKIKAISRGLIMGGASDYVQKSSSKKQGIDITGSSKPANLKELIEADLIVVVADDIPKIIFNYSLEPLNKKLVVWKIKDEQKTNKKNIENIIEKIKQKVEELNRKLLKNER